MHIALVYLFNLDDMAYICGTACPSALMSLPQAQTRRPEGSLTACIICPRPATALAQPSANVISCPIPTRQTRSPERKRLTSQLFDDLWINTFLNEDLTI